MSRADDLFAQLRTGGEAAIDAMIAARASEELFLDFKRSADEGLVLGLHHRTETIWELLSLGSRILKVG